MLIDSGSSRLLLFWFETIVLQLCTWTHLLVKYFVNNKRNFNVASHVRFSLYFLEKNAHPNCILYASLASPDIDAIVETRDDVCICLIGEKQDNFALLTFAPPSPPPSRMMTHTTYVKRNSERVTSEPN